MDGVQGQNDPEELDIQNMRPAGSRVWRAAKVLAKLILVAVLLGWLIASGRLEVGRLASLRQGWFWAVCSLLLIVPQFFLCALRFRLLLSAMDLPGTLRDTFCWTMIGSFFDAAMPLSTGGDVVKAFYVARHAGRGRRSVAVLSVVLDRVVGLLALFVFAWLVCLFAGQRVTDNPELLRVSRVLLVVCAGSVCAFFALTSSYLERSATRQRLMRLLPLHAKFEAVYVAFAGLRRHLGVLLAMMGISLVIQIVGCICILCLAQGLNFTSAATGQPAHLEIVPAMIVLPLAMFLNTFGVAGGIGVGEVAFEALFVLLLGLNGGAELALAFHGVFLVSRLFGLPFVILYRHKAPAQGGLAASAMAPTSVGAGEA
ncbi:MAG: lysylphosphatidylglycerol synthase transmembrane domain-containing protein [Planctomycetota bacterium]|nr:lysylphosphatidylglycerol synthase transmembrane domain-containing protein [Planctomycetota bacterium]